jgi:tetratricopeptide (TPR) repeat protein
MRYVVITGKFARPREVKPDVPRALEAICLKAMALDSADRYDSATELAGEIEAWLADEPVRAWREPLSVRAGRWMRRHRSAVSAALTAALVLVVSLSVGVALLTAANENVRRAKAEVERRQREAQQNFALAHAAVDKYLTRVGDDVRLKAYGLEQLRRDLLETARAFYEQFVEQKPDDPELREQRAWAYFRLAGITADIDSKTDAVQLLLKARDEFQELSRLDPQRDALRGGLAKTHTNLALLHIETGQSQAASDALQTARQISEDLARDDPDDSNYQAELANVHHNLAKVHIDAKAFEKAESAYQQAIEIRQGLVRAHPESLSHLNGLAASQGGLGLLHHWRAQYEQAEELLTAARASQQQLVDKEARVPDYRSELANTCNNLAVLYADLPDRFDDAEQAYQAAIQVRQGLADEHRYVLQYQRDVARSHNNLATLYCMNGRFPQAETSYLAARKTHEALITQCPELPNLKRDLASMLNNLGNLYSDTDRLPDAEKTYRDALEVVDQLVDAFPDDPDCRVRRARINHNLGALFAATDRLEEAGGAYRAAIDVGEHLRAKYPEALNYAFELAMTYANVARVSLELGQPQAALEQGRKAIAILEDQLSRGGKDSVTKRNLRNAHWACAEALSRLGEHQKSLSDWDRAIELEEAPEPLRLGRAEALAQSGDHAAAVQEAKELTEAAEGVGFILYRLAVICAAARRAVEKDDTLAADERTQLVEQYSQTAVDLLERVGEAEYFEDARHVQMLQEDPIWQAFQEREDFRQLRKQVGER